MKKMFKNVQRANRGRLCYERSDNESVGDESLGENEDISSDYEYWDIPMEIEESSASEDECTPVPFPSSRADNRLAGFSSHEDDVSGYIFSRPREVVYVKFVRYIHPVKSHQKEHF